MLVGPVGYGVAACIALTARGKGLQNLNHCVAAVGPAAPEALKGQADMIYTIDLVGAGINKVIRSTAIQGPQGQVIERAKTMFRLRTEMAVRAVRVLADDGRVVFRWNGREADG